MLHVVNSNKYLVYSDEDISSYNLSKKTLKKRILTFNPELALLAEHPLLQSKLHGIMFGIILQGLIRQDITLEIPTIMDVLENFQNLVEVISKANLFEEFDTFVYEISNNEFVAKIPQKATEVLQITSLSYAEDILSDLLASGLIYLENDNFEDEEFESTYGETQLLDFYDNTIQLTEVFDVYFKDFKFSEFGILVK